MSDSDNIIAELESEFVELYKILKFEGLSESGGSAKQAIADGLVSVNGEVETRKRKKIRASTSSINPKNSRADRLLYTSPPPACDPPGGDLTLSLKSELRMSEDMSSPRGKR